MPGAHAAPSSRSFGRRGWRGIVGGGLLAALLATTCVLTALTPGTNSAYVARITNSVDTAATAPYFTCAAAYAADKSNALFQYPLTEATGATTALDVSGRTANGNYQGSMTRSTTTPISCSRDTNSAYVLNGTTSYLSTPTQVTTPATFTLETWFKTTVGGGKLVGFEANQTGTSSVYDRHVYLNPTGQLIFGTYNNGLQTITSPLDYDDNLWHHVIATFSASTGMNLWVDGKNVAANATYTTAEAHAGWWRFGGGNLSGWPTPGATGFFTGSMRYAAVYTVVLSPATISNHYAAGR
ncbi:hypothetical protein B7R54_14590 [Subtercola boreus]|uniref:Signal peptidase I n=1 Tax=Subtercola boreus TaxID=120213 RepID=A0A3E0VPJ7_9MICO|nr:hypothetical protein B7R54_14590 [Subtercola boreus]